MSASLGRAQWRQIGLLTLGAVGLLLGLRYWPTRPELTHMDFVSGGLGALEFCDPANPRFLPVVERSSPVSLLLRPDGRPSAGGTVQVTLLLWTNTGKAIGPHDLLATGTHLMNLLIVDPDLGDFQAVASAPGAHPGEWPFSFTPHRSGTYRIFADFTPAATGQEMYASADLRVAADSAAGTVDMAPASTGTPETVERDGLRFTLWPAHTPLHARELAELNFTVARLDGAPLALQSIDGSPARLVAFDQNRTGFVSLRPESGTPVKTGADGVQLTFKVTIPDPGRYVIWSRINDGRTEVVTPFSLEVVP